MNNRAFAVILAGGQGERFWPLSTAARPKQFLSLVGGRPLLAQAVDRLEGLIPPERVLVITGREQLKAAREAAPELPAANIVGEPFGRDTAAAIALGGALVARRDPEGLMAVLTADQVMGEPERFRRLLGDALETARGGFHLITIGILPTEPSTAFGYIESGDPFVGGKGGTRFLHVRRFVEKPDRETAQTYLRQGGFYWNAGMFIWSLATLRTALEKHCPLLARLMECLAGVEESALADEIERQYAPLEKSSIDYALMEKVDHTLVAPADFPWDDVGSWPALAHHIEPDRQGNVVLGPVELMDSRDTITVSEGGVVALLGVSNVVVVRSGEAVLVCARDRAQDIKALVRQVREGGQAPPGAL